MQAAVTASDAVGMKLFGAATRRRLGQLLDGAAGAELMDQAESAMREEKVRNIHRLTAMYTFPLPRR